MNYTTNKDILDSRMDEIRHIGGTTAEIVAAFRGCKVAKAEIRGKFRLHPTDMAPGLNIRKAKLGSGEAMERLFRPFTSKVKEPLTLPFYDESRKAVVATDGKTMLFCDIPKELTAEEAKKENRFTTDNYWYPNWTTPIGAVERKNTPAALADFDFVGEFEKGSAIHNVIIVASACSRAYRHDDKKGLWHNLYVWIGENQYDPVSVCEMVNALFRLGCGKVGFYYPKFGYGCSAMHIVGFGDGLNARGLVMPMRFPSTMAGGVELPLVEKAVLAA